MAQEESSVERVRAALEAQGMEQLQIVAMEQTTRTAQEAALAIGCQVGQIAKSLVFCGRQSQQPVLVVASGSNRVKESALKPYLGEAVRRPDADYVREHTGFAIGGIPPVGHREPMPCFLDEDLFQYDVLWAAAGSPFAVFAITPQELRDLTGGTVITVAAHAE